MPVVDAERQLKLMAGNATPELAEDIARELDMELGDLVVSRFSDGEIQVDIQQSIRGQDIFLIQSTCHPVNENLMELLIICDALRRATARSISLVIPYYGYARQDKKVSPREPISAKLVADMIEDTGPDRVLSMDLHSNSIQGFFNIPVDHLTAVNMFIEHIKEMDIPREKTVIVSPDVNGVARANQVSRALDVDLAIVAKRRPKPNVSEVIEVIGDVEGKTAIIVDDMIDTAGSIVGAAEQLTAHGAGDVYAFATHGIFSGPATERIQSTGELKEVHVTDTIPRIDERDCEKITRHSCASLLAEAIRRGFERQSISSLFD